MSTAWDADLLARERHREATIAKLAAAKFARDAADESKIREVIPHSRRCLRKVVSAVLVVAVLGTCVVGTAGSSPAPSSPLSSVMAVAKPLRVETRDMDCTTAAHRAHSEYDGSVVRTGGPKGLVVSSAAHCCAECQGTRGCNVWVFGPANGACWLKRQDDPLQPRKRADSPSTPWTSGALPKAYWDRAWPLPPADPSIQYVWLRTKVGSIRLRLKDDWHKPSADSVRALEHPPPSHSLGRRVV